MSTPHAHCETGVSRKGMAAVIQGMGALMPGIDASIRGVGGPMPGVDAPTAGPGRAAFSTWPRCA
jgi:hypothetical protein